MTQLDRIEQMLRQQIESTGAAVTATAGVTTGPTGPTFAQGTGPLNKDRSCVCKGTGWRFTTSGDVAPCNHCNP